MADHPHAGPSDPHQEQPVISHASFIFKGITITQSMIITWEILCTSNIFAISDEISLTGVEQLHKAHGFMIMKLLNR